MNPALWFVVIFVGACFAYVLAELVLDILRDWRDERAGSGGTFVAEPRPLVTARWDRTRIYDWDNETSYDRKSQDAGGQ